tara:strand:+ start:1213 stop:1626 length:414 start_codon:yes stop_codon:yes gene_type:complete
MPIDFKRDTNGDIALENGNFSLVSGRTAVAQFLWSRLESFVGEWFMNFDYGSVDKERMLVKAPNLSYVSAVRKAQVVAVPGIRSVSEYKMSLDPVTRNLQESFAVILEEEEAVLSVSSVGSSGGMAVVLLGEYGGIT